MKKLLATLIAVVIALAAGFAGGMYYAKNNTGDHYDPVVIEEKIVEISELASLECDYTDAGKYKGDAKKVLGFNLPFTSKEMMITYSGIVKMGPKLKDNMEVNLDQNAEKVTVVIPHSEILSHEVDEDSVKITYVKNGVFNSVTPQNVNDLRKEMKNKYTKHIEKDTDYLEQADEKAVDQITAFLNSAYPDLDVEVEFQEH